MRTSGGQRTAPPCLDVMAGDYAAGFDQIPHHLLRVSVTDRQVFARPLGVRLARRVEQRGFRLKDPALAIGGQFAGDQRVHAWRQGFEEAHRHLRTEGVALGGHHAGPDHDLVQHGGDQPAMDDVPEADVLGPGPEPGPDDASVRLEAQFEPGGVGFPADKTRMGMRQFQHGANRGFLRASGKLNL